MALSAPLRRRRVRRIAREEWASRAPLIALVVLTALALVPRILGMDQTLYADENFTYSIITRGGLGSVWHDVYHTSITPPLHYVLAWLAVQFGGDSTVLIRLPSLLFGTALVPLVFLIARRSGGARAGLLGAALIALSPFAIWYSDEARAYATMMFFVALSTFALLRALQGDGRRWWIVYALSACAALWSHYTAVFVVVAEGLWALWAHRGRWRELAIANVAIAIGYLPWLPGFLEQRKNQVGIGAISEFGPLSFGAVYKLPLRTLIGHPHFGLGSFPGDKKGLLLVLVVVALVLAAAIRRPAVPRLAHLLRSERGLILILALATPLGLVLYAVASSPLFLPRNLSASLPALAVLVALLLSGLATIVPVRLAAPAIAIVVAVLGLNAVDSLSDQDRRPPYREAAHYIDEVAGAKDPVVELPLALTLDKRIPPTTLGLYLEHKRRVYRAGLDAAPAWRQLRSGRDVYLVTTSQFLASNEVERQAGGAGRVPTGLLRRLALLGGPQGRAVVRARKDFPGIIPVSAVRYRGIVDGRLERRGGRQLISWSLGEHVSVSPGVARGSVDAVSPSDKPLLLGGWALDATRPRLVDWILFFSRGRLFAVSAGGQARPDIAKAYGASALLAGFGIVASPAPSDRSTIRVFALVGNRASELPFSEAVKRSVGESTAPSALRLDGRSHPAGDGG